MQPPSNALVRLWRFARPHAGGLAFSLGVGFGMTAAALVIPPITGAIVDEVRAGRTDRLLPLAATILAAGALESLLAFARRYVGAVFSIRMEQEMRNELYAHLQRLPVSFHDGWQSGQLLSRAMGDLSTIRRFVGFGFLFLMINFVQFVAVFVLILRLDPWLALLTFGFGVPIVALSFRFNKTYHDIAREVQDETGDMATVIEEAATGIRIIKAFGRGRFVSDRFRAQADDVHDSNMRAVLLHARFRGALRFLPNLNLVVALAIGGVAVVRGSLTPGGLSEFVLYLASLQWPIRSIGWILATAEEARTAAERYFEVIDTVPEIRDREGARALEGVEGRIRFEEVSFRYPGTDGLILRDVTLEVEPGETLAVVGTTGCGKTTLVSLVSRLYDASEGRVTIDGTDVRDATLESLRRHVGVAFEDPALFSMSVRENLLLGYPQATEDEIRRALETAHAEFVHELPWGLETRIGEQGYSLSGGQRQRLALARAVIARPQVLVLDDPLSSVDVHTEAQIEAALASVLHGVTALLVVHRPSTLALADRVALIHDGTVAAVGTHHDLMETNALYRDILSMEAEILPVGLEEAAR